MNIINKLGSINPYQFFSDINEQLIKDGLIEIKNHLLKRDEEIFLSDETRKLGFNQKVLKKDVLLHYLEIFRLKLDVINFEMQVRIIIKQKIMVNDDLNVFY